MADGNPELIAKIGADASDLIAGSKEADRAWSRFTGNLAKETNKARNSLGQFTNETKRVRDEFGRFSKATNPGRDSLGRFAKGSEQATKALGGLQREEQLTTKETLALGAALGKLAGPVGVALEGLKALTLGAAALAVALAGIGGKAAVEFSKFETSFAQITTLLPDSFSAVGELETGVRNLAVRFGKDLTEATKGAYEAISSGVEPAKVLGFLETAFKGAAAGAATTAEVVNLITSALNAFGIPVEEATRVSDVFFQTINIGKTTASELASSIGQVAPIAAAAGVSLEEVGAALATLTASGLSTAEAATQIKATIEGVVAPSKEAKAALEGIGLSAEVLRNGGLVEVFTRLRDATGGSFDAIAKFLPNIRASAAGASLAGQSFDKFNASLRQITDSAGSTDRAFGKTAATLGTSFSKLTAQIQNTFVSIGKLIAPALGPALEAVGTFLGNIQEEFEVLAGVVGRDFAETLAKFFKGLSQAAEASKGVVTGAMRVIGGAIASVGDFFRTNATVIAEWASSYTTSFAVVEGVFGGLLTAVGLLSRAMSVTLSIGSQIASLFSDRVSRALDQASQTAERFGKAAQAFGVDRLVSSFDALTGTDETFAAIERSVIQAGQALNTTGGYLEQTANQVDRLRASQDAQEEAARKATVTTTALGKSQAELAAAAQRSGLAISANAEAMGAAADAAGEAAAGQDELGSKTEATTRKTEALTTALDTFTISAKAALKDVSFEAGNLSAALANAFAKIDQILKGSFKDAALSLLDPLAQGKIAVGELTAEVDRLRELQRGFLDPKVFDDFIAASGNAKINVRDFGQVALDALRTVSNVLKDDFREDATVLITAFAQGRISARDFAAEVQRLADAQAASSDKVTAALERQRLKQEQLKQATTAQAAALQAVNQANQAVSGGVITLAGAADEATSSIGGLNSELTAGAAAARAMKDELDGVAAAAANAGAASSGGAGRISAFGGAPGGLQISNNASGGSSSLGFQGTVTGSSSYANQQEAQLGAALGLKPKALRQRAARTPGGMAGLYQQVFGASGGGAGQFVQGGPVTKTGPGLLEAGEGVLSHRGMNDLGKLMLKLLNKGQGFTQNFNSTFQVGPAEQHYDVRRLAFELRPQLAQVGTLAAARSPIT